uniref:Glycerol uptake protein n=1 Tax=Rhizophora mucronata TaxID=61149 RepID=A0A2P2KKV8_RHIMU
MEKFPWKFTCSYFGFRTFCLGGQCIKGPFWFKSQGDVHCLAFHFFGLPFVSSWSLHYLYPVHCFC